VPPQQTCCCKGGGEEPCPNCWEQATFGCTPPCCWCEELEGLCEGTQEYDAALAQCEFDWRNLTPAQRPCGENFRVTVDVPSYLTFTSDGGEALFFDKVTIENTFGVQTIPSLTTPTDEQQVSGTMGLFYTSHVGVPGDQFGFIADANQGGAFPLRGDSNDLRRNGMIWRSFEDCMDCPQDTSVDPTFGGTWPCGCSDLRTCANSFGWCGKWSGGGCPAGDWSECEGGGEFLYEENQGWLRKESDLTTSSIKVWDCPIQTVQINVTPDFTVCNETCSYYGSVDLDSGDSVWKFIGIRNERDTVNTAQTSGHSCSQFNCTSAACREYEFRCSDCWQIAFDSQCNYSSEVFTPKNNQKRKVANLDEYNVPITWTLHYHLRPLKRKDASTLYPNSEYFWEQTIALSWTPDWTGITIAEGTEDIKNAEPVKPRLDVSQDQVMQGPNTSNGTGPHDPQHNIWTPYGDCNKSGDCQSGMGTADCHNKISRKFAGLCDLTEPDAGSYDCQSFSDEYYGNKPYAPGVNFRRTYVSPDTHSDNSIAAMWYGGYEENHPTYGDPGEDYRFKYKPVNTQCGQQLLKAPEFLPYASGGYNETCSVGDPYSPDCKCISGMHNWKIPDYPSLHAQLPAITTEWEYEYVWGWSEDVQIDVITGEGETQWSLSEFFDKGNMNYTCQLNNSPDTHGVARKLLPRDTNCAPNCPSSIDGTYPITDWSYNGWSIEIGDF